MMDSHHPSRVYDDDTLTSGGTNADVVSDILSHTATDLVAG
jgi:hypothetical protein